jgi:hypothetical protein
MQSMEVRMARRVRKPGIKGKVGIMKTGNWRKNIGVVERLRLNKG